MANHDDFKYLMDQLKIETEKSQKSTLSSNLSELLLMINGFNAYYDYISNISDDQIECMNIFCKVVLTKPLKFLDDLVF